MPITVGIPLCLDDRGRWRRQRNTHYVDAAYAEAVEAAGGLPVYLPLQRDVEALLDRVDGLLLPGGDDFIPPTPYPETVSFETVSPTQLEFDMRLLTGALQRNQPVLAICYGMQLLALQHGGTLVYDIETELPGARVHMLTEADGRHPLLIEANSLLAHVLGDTPTAVNSLHHQGVANPGSLRVVARAEDGVAEAVEDDQRRFCIGVQWHPEKMTGPHRDALFAAFVKACREATQPDLAG